MFRRFVLDMCFRGRVMSWARGMIFSVYKREVEVEQYSPSAWEKIEDNYPS